MSLAAIAVAARFFRLEQRARLFDERRSGVRPQYSRCLGRRHPTATPQFLILPVFRYGFDFHEIDRHGEKDAALLVLVPAEGLTNDAPSQAGFFPSFVQGRLFRRVSSLDGALGYSPTAGGGSRDQAD